MTWSEPRFLDQASSPPTEVELEVARFLQGKPAMADGDDNPGWANGFPPTQAQPEAVNHPKHYGGDTPYEAIKVIEAWDLGFCLGNTIKYLARAGRKPGTQELEDLEKARWYLDREIASRRAKTYGRGDG